MRIAVEGCCHGELDAIYASIAEVETRTSTKVDLLLVCGDFQALRNPSDLHTLAVPQKYKALGSFHSYYSGQKAAPVLTITIGGNHESSGYMWELYHGGWLAPNIYYLGCAGSVMVNGLRISGASGIWKVGDYRIGHYESIPYTPSSIRSCYHTREYDIFRLSLLPRPDIFISHDWPLGIEQYGDIQGLIRRKPFFRDEINKNDLGSPPLASLLNNLRPDYWFAAHLHVKFAALWRPDGARPAIAGHNARPVAQQVSYRDAEAEPAAGTAADPNPDEIAIDLNEDATAAPAPNPDEIAVDLSDDEEPPSTREASDSPALPPAPPSFLPPKPVAAAAAAAGDPPIDERVTVLERVRAGADANPIVIGDEDTSGQGQTDAGRETSSADVAGQNNPEDIAIIGDKTVGAAAPAVAAALLPQAAQETKFLALDKCLPNRDFLQILDIPTPVAVAPDSPPTLTFDPHWLAITRALHPFLSITRQAITLPPRDEARSMVEGQLGWCEEQFTGVEVESVQAFAKTAPAYGTGEEGGEWEGQPSWYTNPQTEALCAMLDVPNRINPAPPPAGSMPPPPPSHPLRQSVVAADL